MSDPLAFVGLHHEQLAIPAGSEDECRSFWRDVLGMTEVSKPPVLAARGGCWFRGGGLADRLESADFPVLWDDAFPGFGRF
jgi:catechol 2,3-dioxygenase-like lactoylglutathione lyase family enzyme